MDAQAAKVAVAATVDEQADELVAASQTAIDVWSDPDLLPAVRSEFEETVRER